MPVRRDQDKYKQMELLSPEKRAEEPSSCQEHWYHIAARLGLGLRVVDVGAGMPYTREILEGGGAAQLLSIDPLPMDPRVVDLDVAQLSSNAFDLVTLIDVIEHVRDDRGLLANTVRVAQQAVFLTTPNFDVWGCKNVYHYREYSAVEIEELLRPYDVAWWTAGTNRFASGPRRIDSPHAADATFAVLIRTPSCSTDAWKKLLKRNASITGDWVLQRMTRHGVHADEWGTRVKDVAASAQDPRAAVVSWVSDQFALEQPGIKPLDKPDVITALRHGVVTWFQRAKVLSWAFNTVPITTNAQVHECFTAPVDSPDRWVIRDEGGYIYNAAGTVLMQCAKDPS